ncbi:Jag N-terminal domain-containing protein [Helicobacter pylori]|uniref:SpoIIIJ-associated protein n=1 Tax=Helicobacter pylori (strain B8) TaxID=693745 RepID=D7FBT5_HELP3|nr:Jag N-terminal domain-containing protein [Helicobacter pylori]AVG73072.1 spoIIIJ-associated protein [Helicobacter pylori]AVG79114.1 spoIIIJ-associated protein [Helicobacter pylori]AVG80588.1 spoIIIJ-associated protein [Helicobacter pylori]AVG82073.1 spoIIIJ-associated protein [Helicobacter pylori]AVG83447.1 spoIIIJ-associated protein [Helicobacter pylori]
MQNFIEIKAKTLEEALIQASIALNCPIINLQYEVIQTPSKGFLSIGKKEAIILAGVKESVKEVKEESVKETNTKENHQNNIEEKKQKLETETPQEERITPKPPKKNLKEESHNGDKLHEIKQELKELFSHLPYKINKVEVSLYEPGVLLIDIDGEDSALLIGEKGYRYKALSYLLFNWIHPAYGYSIRLEISTFLQNQEKVMEAQLQSVIMTVHEVGKGQMKAPDGVLTYIALKKLRKAFPNKYVSIKTNLNDEKYIVINDFNNE